MSESGLKFKKIKSGRWDMSDSKKVSEKPISKVETIDYGVFGALKIIPIEKTLFNELDIEIYSKVMPYTPPLPSL